MPSSYAPLGAKLLNHFDDSSFTSGSAMIKENTPMEKLRKSTLLRSYGLCFRGRRCVFCASPMNIAWKKHECVVSVATSLHEFGKQNFVRLVVHFCAPLLWPCVCGFANRIPKAKTRWVLFYCMDPICKKCVQKLSSLLVTGWVSQPARSYVLCPGFALRWACFRFQRRERKLSDETVWIAYIAGCPSSRAERFSQKWDCVGTIKIVNVNAKAYNNWWTCRWINGSTVSGCVGLLVSSLHLGSHTDSPRFLPHQNQSFVTLPWRPSRVVRSPWDDWLSRGTVPPSGDHSSHRAAPTPGFDSPAM